MKRIDFKTVTTSNKDGFTLIELLVAMLISGILMIAIYTAFQSNLRSYLTQKRVVDMQQNIRVSFFYITKDIMMAGYDPGDDKAGAGFTNAQQNTLTFTADLNENDTIDANETFTYALDANSNVTRNGTILAENVNVLDFVYLDEDGGVLPYAGGVIADMTAIVSVQITIIVQDGDQISQMTQEYTDNKVYYNQQGDPLLDKSGTPDQFRRRRYSAEINCRNMML